MQVSLYFARNTGKCERCEGEIDTGQLVIALSDAWGSHPYHYLCLREVQVYQYEEKVGLCPESSIMYVGGCVLLPTDVDGEYENVTMGMRVHRVGERWEEVVKT